MSYSRKHALAENNVICSESSLYFLKLIFIRILGYQEALKMVPFQPQNQDELMMFFGHVSHETDGLKTYEEYCGQSGKCADDYQDSWCQPVQAEPGKQYYGRGWFQLSWPCNYNAAGNALGVDLLRNPEQVADSDTLAAATALWFWNANNMGQPARNGNFGGTTQIINRIECGQTPQQENRIDRYQRVRICFGLSPATDNLRC
jgi:predicted chitinase